MKVVNRSFFVHAVLDNCFNNVISLLVITLTLDDFLPLAITSLLSIKNIRLYTFTKIMPKGIIAKNAIAFFKEQLAATPTYKV